jgi:hypothetical protein
LEKYLSWSSSKKEEGKKSPIFGFIKSKMQTRNQIEEKIDL